MLTRSLKNLISCLQSDLVRFFVKKLVGKNAVKVDLPSDFKIHDDAHVVRTTPYHEQKRPDPVLAVGG